jgi:hypothetical protein
LASFFPTLDFDPTGNGPGGWTPEQYAEWHYRRFGIWRAWKYWRGGPGCIPILMDSGVRWNFPSIQYGHHPEDFPYQWSTYFNTADATLVVPVWPPGHLDGQGNDIGGQPIYTESNMHGSQLADSVCSEYSRIAPDCGYGYMAIGSVTVDMPTPDQAQAGLVKAIEWATTYGKRVVVAYSANWSGGTTAWQTATDYLWNNGGILFCAAGNTNTPVGTSGYVNPTILPNVVGVGGTDHKDSGLGCYGANVDWVCSYRAIGALLGTSFASPEAMMMAALVWSAYPALTNQQLLDAFAADGDYFWPVPKAGQGARAFDQPAFIPRVDRTLMRVLALNPANAGTIYPCLEFHAADRGPYGRWDLIKRSHNNLRIDLFGSVYATMKGYCSNAVTSVQLKIGSTVLYDGPPTDNWWFDTSTWPVGPVTYTVRTSGGNLTETYDDVAVNDPPIRVGGAKLRTYLPDMFRVQLSGYGVEALNGSNKLPQGIGNRFYDGVALRVGDPSRGGALRVTTSAGVRSLDRSSPIPPLARILNDNPDACWGFDEGTYFELVDVPYTDAYTPNGKSWRDLTGHGRHLCTTTFYGYPPTFHVLGVDNDSGQPTYAVQSGSELGGGQIGDIVNATDLRLSNFETAFSFECWVYPFSSVGENILTDVWAGDYLSGPFYGGIGIGCTGGSMLRPYFGLGNGYHFTEYIDAENRWDWDYTTGIKVVANNDILSNAWSHLAFTYDGSGSPNGVKIYVNGVEVAVTRTGAGGSGAISHFLHAHSFVGWGPTGSVTQLAKFDNMASYVGRVLTSSQILFHYRGY